MSEKLLTITSIGLIQLAGYFALRGAWLWLQNEPGAV